MSPVVWIVVGVVLIFVMSIIGSYNRFVSQRNLVAESWTQVGVELQRRHDLIPNLVSAVKGYATHEEATLEKVTQARAVAVSAANGTPAERQGPETTLDSALRGLLAVSEAYPDLKASANFLSLQAELTNTEDRIAASRRFYTGNVRAFNTRLQSFPSSVIGSMFGFTPAEFFEAEAGAMASLSALF